ncbi:MAG: extracellular solute-binding protein [Clostridia bacterium]|nr:extracellular solute-binding protein [Clostridia bacterium]
MKRALCVLLAVVLIVSMFSGCAGKPGPLRICVDLEYIYGGDKISVIETYMYDLESSLMNNIGLSDYVIEYIPRTGSERSNAIDRIRTEIMSGGGPDVFIVNTAGGEWFTPSGEALFLQPEKAMEAGIFLPLDSYIENAQYAEWDKLTPEVMAGGKNREGQQLVPLTYSVPTAIYLSSDFSHTPSRMTWSDMLNEKELFDTAARLGDARTMSGSFDFPADYILGDLADYRQETLAFSEEDLLKRVNEVMELTEYTTQNELYEVPNWSESSIGVGFNTSEGGYRYSEVINGIGEEDTYSLVPLYSDDGGCTAMVLSFAAVNRNTQRPQDAFAVIDCLLSTSKQMNAKLYTDLLYRRGVNASMPMHEEIMTEEKRVYAGLYPLSEENFTTLSAVRDQITNVQFAGQLNIELQNMMLECYDAHRFGEGYTDIVHRAYETMDRILGE